MNNIFSKTLLGNSIQIFAIRFMSLLASLFGIIYYSHYLIMEEHGKYTFFLTTMAIVVSMGSLGLGSTIFNFSDQGFIRYFKELNTKKWINYIIYLLVLSILFAGIWQLLSFEYFDGSIIVVVLIFFLLAILNFLGENILLLYHFKKQQFFINLIYSVFVIIIHFIAENENKLNFFALFSYWSIALLLKNIFQILLFKNALNTTYNPLGDVEDLRPTKKTWWQLGFYEIFQAIVKQSDRFIVGMIASKEAAAIYFNGRIDIPFLPAILSSVRNATLIKLSKQSNQDNQIIQITHQTFSILSTICISVVAFGIIYSSELLIVVFSEKYLSAQNIFIWSLLILPAQYCISLTYLLQYKEKANIINKGAFLDLIICILLLYPFYKWWGISGIAISVCLSTYIQSIYYAFQTGKTLELNALKLFPWEDYIWKIITTLIVASISKWVFNHYFNNHWIFIIGGFIGLFWVMFLLKNDLKKQIKM